MTVKSKPNGATVSALPALDVFNAAVSQASKRSVAILEAGFENWTKESQHFYDEMSAQGTAALEQLKGCKSPFEMLSVEQTWLAARAKNYLETGMRLAQAFSAISQPPKTAESPKANAVGG